MLNKTLEAAQIKRWQIEFETARPFRYLIIDDFLEPVLAEELSNKFPGLGEMNVNYRGMNERKSEHSDFFNLPPVFAALKKRLSEVDVTTAIGTITQISNLELINDRFGFGLHQGGKDSFLDIHVDYNLHPLKRKQRRINLILFLNRYWEKNWGGALEFWNKDVTKCEQSILPLFNRCVLFECNEYSFHGYSKINCPKEETRRSFYQYYFTEPEEKILFHDTLFKSKPGEALSKKIMVRIKETAKNTSKRLLYKLRLSKLLR
jgi:Rps23 Pro-64 3,4-dihydroxylase Tpa1-like proline 4-hydroxylase